MSTKVRSLTTDEQAKVAELLMKLHAHTDNCSACQKAINYPSGMCSAGADLYRLWDIFIDAMAVADQVDQALR